MKTKILLLFVLAALLIAALPAGAQQTCQYGQVNGQTGLICRSRTKDGLTRVHEAIQIKEGYVYTYRDSYYDEDGKPALCENGYFSVTYEYTIENDHLDHELYSGTDGEPINTVMGYAEVIHELTGNENRARYLDADGNFCAGSNGVAQTVTVWNDDHTESSISYLDLDGNPTANDGVCFLIRKTYDEKGFTLSANSFDAEGHRISGTLYHENGRIASVTDYDAEGNVLSETRYDTEGNVIE